MSRQIGIHDTPNDVEVDVEVSVNEAIPHAARNVPRNVVVTVAKRCGNAFCGLANNLQKSNQGRREHLIGVEIGALSTLRESERFIRGILHVAETNRVIRPRHTAPVLRP